MKTVFDRTTDGLAASLKLRSLRHNITSSNIANAETPGYHAKKVDFEDALQRALDVDAAGSNPLAPSQMATSRITWRSTRMPSRALRPTFTTIRKAT